MIWAEWQLQRSCHSAIPAHWDYTHGIDESLAITVELAIVSITDSLLYAGNEQDVDGTVKCAVSSYEHLADAD